MADEAVEVARTDLFAARDARVKLLENAAGDFAAGLRAGEDHHVPVRMGFDAEPVLNQG
jgi:hypothetical protein